MTFIHTFKEQLAEYLTKSENPNDNLINFEVLNKSDFSFTVNLKLWIQNEKNLNVENVDKFNNNILVYTGGDEGIKNASEKFAFQIQELEVVNTKCFIKIMRNAAIRTILESISTSDYGNEPKNGETVSINVSKTDSFTITDFRLQTIAVVLKNLITYSKYTLPLDDSCADHRLLLTTRSNIRKDECLDSNIQILCSVVHDEHNKKVSSKTAEEYRQKRMDEMHLMAVHKYGVRMENDESILKLREQLGDAASKLDMIEVKHSNALTLTNDPKQAFILYNSARIETLLNTFNDKVATGYYPALPNFSDIDINLLTSDEEWILLKQLMLFPEIIQNSIGDFKNGKIGIHLLYKYLQNMAITFSNYYSKKKVLTENRPQLIPVLHAKIHLLKAFQIVFNKTLEIIDIQPVMSM